MLTYLAIALFVFAILYMGWVALDALRELVGGGDDEIGGSA